MNNNNNIENENDKLKKNISNNADEEIEIVDNNNNIIQDLMESKTKFDFHKAGFFISSFTIFFSTLVSLILLLIMESYP